MTQIELNFDNPIVKKEISLLTSSILPKKGVVANKNYPLSDRSRLRNIVNPANCYNPKLFSAIDPSTLQLARKNVTINEEAIKKEAKLKLDALTDTNTNNELFTMKPANEWIEQASKRPMPNKLYHELWHEGELCILFGDTGSGKSILAVQIGNNIAKNQYVIYIDFELSDKQFELRYNEGNTDFRFNPKLLRIEINPDCDVPDSISFEDFVLIEIERLIKESGAKVLIVDNITFITTETEKAKNALPLMKRLKQLKRKYDLSLLVIAHTPKRDSSKPLSVNDLAGSKMLANFTDALVGMGQSSKDVSIRYIKQMKARNTEILYGSEKILLFELNKQDGYLQMIPVGFGSESDHLREESEAEKFDLAGNIIYLHENEPGLSYEQIAHKLGTYKMKVKRVIDKQNSVTQTSVTPQSL